MISTEECSICTEKNVYFAADEWNILYTCVRSIWSAVLFKASASLISFLSGCLSIIQIWVLKSPTFIALPSSFSFSSFSVCFLYLGVLIVSMYLQLLYIPGKLKIVLYLFWVTLGLLVIVTLRLFSLIDVWPLYSLQVINSHGISFFQFFHLHLICVLKSKVNL